MGRFIGGEFEPPFARIAGAQRHLGGLPPFWPDAKELAQTLCVSIRVVTRLKRLENALSTVCAGDALCACLWPPSCERLAMLSAREEVNEFLHVWLWKDQLLLLV